MSKLEILQEFAAQAGHMQGCVLAMQARENLDTVAERRNEKTSTCNAKVMRYHKRDPGGAASLQSAFSLE